MIHTKHLIYWVSISLISISCSSYKGKSDYLSKRDKMISQHEAQSFSHELTLSAQEDNLNKLMSKLQQDAIHHYKESHFFPPARNFYISKEHVESTALFELITSMPKGGALHIHTAAMGNLNWIVDRAIATPEMYVYWSEDKPNDKGMLHAYSNDALPPGYISAAELLADDDNRTRFKQYFLFDQSMDRDSVDIWGRFESVFKRLDGFVNYEGVFEDYLVHGLSLLAADGVQHVELRMPFKNLLYSTGGDDHPRDIDEFANEVHNGLARVRESYPDFTAKIIHANLRFRSNELISSDMKTILELRQKYPDLLVGYDLVAEEDAGHTTLYHLESFLELQELNKKAKFPLDLYLHDGESNWVDNQNLYDAVMLDSKRIGHGFNLFRYPQLMDIVNKKNICIEVNPLSNQILGYIRDLRLHPAYTYISEGIDISISSDDPLIFDYEGLSYDYWHVYMAWQLDLKDLKQLSKNGIEHAALTSAEKDMALKNWERRWQLFINESIQKLSTHEN